MAANEQHTIERYYAYSAARTDIECFCRLSGHNAEGRPEWDTARLTEGDEDLRHDIAHAVAYLDSRHLLLRPHPENPSIVVIQPNDEERRDAAAPVALYAEPEAA